MPDVTFEVTEMVSLLERLITADSWNSAFSLLEQEQAKLSDPEAKAALLSIIEEKQQQHVQQTEVDVLTKYLLLLRNLHEWNLPAAWETFISSFLNDETRLTISTALVELEEASTVTELKQVFERNRSLFLSEAAELFQQLLLAHMLQDESKERDDLLDDLRHLKTFFDLHRVGNEKEAWDLLEEVWNRQTARRQQAQEVLDLLFDTVKGPEHLCALLRENQTVLLTSTARLELDFLIGEEGDSSDPQLRWLICLRDLLNLASLVGMQQACDEMGIFLYNALHADQQFQSLLLNWLNISQPREQRRFLEQHLEIVQMHMLYRLQRLIEIESEDEEAVAILNDSRSILKEISQRGERLADVRETYVNRVGGWSLDVPAWLEKMEARVMQLAERPDQDDMRITALRKAITRAQQDANVAPETVAALQHDLGRILRTTPLDDPSSSVKREEAIVMQLAALQTFTFARYPIQHARVQLELGECYIDRVMGNESANTEQALFHLEKALQVLDRNEFPLEWADAQISLGQAYYQRTADERSENLERARACQLAALEIYRQENSPIQWGEIQAYLGRTYQDRILGEKRENIECALACLSGALEVFSPEMFPVEWATIHPRLGQLYVERVDGDRRENLRLAEKHLQQTLQVYTSEAFPQDRAMSHLMLGGFYTDFGPALELNKDYCVLALEHFQQAEQVLTVKTAPEQWALIQQWTILVSLSQREGVSRSTFQRVIARGKEVLDRLPRAAYPFAWAGIQVALSQALSLNVVYAERIPDRAEMLEQALEHIGSALQVYTPANAPVDWAKAQRIQAQIYMERLNGKRSENLERARYSCEQALQALNPERSAHEWAEVQTILGTVLMASQDKRKETIEQAIACFKRSLERCDPITSSFTWARNHIRLCHAYVERIEGNRQENIETAIKHGETAIQACAREKDPIVWAEAQFYLGIAYARRIAGERRVNIERSILCFAYAAEIFTNEQTPLMWEAIQGNLGSIYYERAEGKANASTVFALEHMKHIQALFSDEDISREIALVQMRMAMICHNLVQSPEDEHALQAESLYRKALQRYLHENDSLNAAYVYVLLGEYYRNLLRFRNEAAWRKEAHSCYRAALQTFTRERTPYQWAIVQLGLGALVGLTPGESPTSQQEQAVAFLKQATAILTPETFPYQYLGLLSTWLLVEWERGNWQEVARIAQAIHTQKVTLLGTSTGTGGLDAVLASAPHISPTARGALATLLRINQQWITPGSDWSQNMIRLLALPEAPAEDIEQAALLLESGRAMELARSLTRYLAAPERIRNVERRARYEEARKQMLLSRKELDQTASLNNVKPSALQARKTFLERTAACEVAQQAFEEIVAEIRQAQDPADFYTLSIDRTTLQQAARQGGPGHTLVYLVALEKIGGFAIAIQASDKPEDTSLRFASCILPGLTSEVIQGLVKNGAEQHLSSYQEKLAPLLFQPLLRWFRKKLKPFSLTLIPCGYLTGLPLASLLIDGEKTLGDYFPTSVAPSALSLLHTQPSDNARGGVYTFGDPRRNLSFAEAEAYTLRYFARQLGITGTSKVQKNATSRALQETLKFAEVIAVACHGYVNTDDYLQSYLALDNNLTLGIILNWQRDMQGLRLLILSACEPAAADLQGAVDEVRSISSAMLQAGARAVLAPLWKVNDRATFLLITRFAIEWFPQMKTEPPAAALARAQGWLRTVTNKELQDWEAKILPRSNEEQQASMTNNRREMKKAFSDVASAEGLQQLRSDRQDAERIIRQSARQDRPDLRPYADPIYWAGFQIIGW